MPGFKVQVREGTPMRINKVNDLLLHNPKGWNRELIERVFDPYEADIIQQIPLAQGNIPDSIIWNYDPRGEYNVKSGYKVQWSGQIDQQRQENRDKQLYSTLSQYKKVWKST